MSSFGFGNSGGLDQTSLSQYAAMGGHTGYDMYKGSLIYISVRCSALD